MESYRIRVPFAADPTSSWDSNRRRKRLKVAASSVRSLVESHKFGGPPTVMTWIMYMCAWLCVCANIYKYMYITVYIYIYICIQYPLSFIYWIYWLIWLFKLGFDVYAFIYVHSKIDVNFTSNMMSNGADASCPQVSGDGFLHKPRPIFHASAGVFNLWQLLQPLRITLLLGMLVLPTHLRKMSRSLSLPNSKQKNNIINIKHHSKYHQLS
jgi:hypothetical protein